METIALGTFLFVMLYLMSRVLAVYLRVRDEGVQHSEELLRNGVTFGALRDGLYPITVPGRSFRLVKAY